MNLFLVLLAAIASIQGVSGTAVVSDSVSTNAGTVSYSISYSNGIGSLTNKPTATTVANNVFISVAVEGCSIQDANWIYGQLDANAAGGDSARVFADIRGPGASVTNYNLYGYVTPNLAWAGQYADFIKGSYMDLYAHSQNAWSPDYAVAESKFITNNAGRPVFTAYNWYQDSMAGGSWCPFEYPQREWAMSNVYYGTGVVQSTNPNDRIDIITSNAYYAPVYPYPIWSYADDWTSGYNFLRINGISMAYNDPAISWSNVDGVTANSGIYSYSYVNLNQGIYGGDTIYW